MTERLLAQLKQRFASEVLWHFVGRSKTDDERYLDLLSILEEGFRLPDHKEELKFYDRHAKKRRTLWGYAVICLADIPLKDLHIHAERYGQYAIGFHKDSVIDHGFNPVLYANQHSPVFHDFICLRDELENLLEREDKALGQQFGQFLTLLGSVVKAGDLKANPVNDIDWDKEQLNNFYYEREWRSLLKWDFKAGDVAAIIIPDHRIDLFTEDRKNPSLKIREGTPVLPYSMIYRL